MTAPVQEVQARKPFAQGSIIWEKKGPLPVWAWAALLLGLVLVVMVWRRNKSTNAQSEAAAGAPTPTDSGLTNVGQTPIFILPQGTNGSSGPQAPATFPHAPPGGGRHHPPSQAPSAPPPTQNTPPEPTSADVPVGANLYDWAWSVHPLPPEQGGEGASLNWLRGLNGGASALDKLLGTDWQARPGTTTKQPVTTKKATVRLV